MLVSEAGMPKVDTVVELDSEDEELDSGAEELELELELEPELEEVSSSPLSNGHIAWVVVRSANKAHAFNHIELISKTLGN